MKSLGLLGGTSWHSTVEYYSLINTAINTHFGNNTNPPLLVYTLNQHEIHQNQKNNNWDLVAEQLIDGANKLTLAGAEALMFCANTPHKVYNTVVSNTSKPIIHIADITSKNIKENGISKVGFIGTIFSMKENFITDRFKQNNVDVIVPQDNDTLIELHRIIHEELTFGKIIPASKQFVLTVFEQMIDQGAQGLVLGCTEFPLMISAKDITIPIFDTTKLHAAAAVDFILSS